MQTSHERQKMSEERLKTCKDCEHFIKPLSICKKCGCILKIKTRMPWESCPIGKWAKDE